MAAPTQAVPLRLDARGGRKQLGRNRRAFWLSYGSQPYARLGWTCQNWGSTCPPEVSLIGGECEGGGCSPSLPMASVTAAPVSPAAMRTPAVTMMPAVMAVVSPVPVVLVIAEIKIQCDRWSNVTRIAVVARVAVNRISWIVRIGRRIHGAAAEAGGQQKRSHATTCRAHIINIHGNFLTLRTCLDCSSGCELFNHQSWMTFLHHQSKNPAQAGLTDVNPRERGFSYN